MAKLKENMPHIALPSSIKRGIASALDTTSVWYNHDLMLAYAKGGEIAENAGVPLTSYVGQILALVEENKKIATAFIITNEEGDLREIGSTTLVDDKTISFETGVLNLKNWGKEYYAWIEPVGEVGKENYVEGFYEKQIVDENHPWIAGLEPRSTISTDGTIEIAWYEPSTISIDGVSSSITSIQNTVNILTEEIGTVEDTAGEPTVYGAINEIKEKNILIEDSLSNKIDISGGQLTGNLILPDGSIAASEIMVTSKILSEIESAGHLKREILTELPPIEEAKENTIYMILNTEETYDEYILINGKFELIGNTSIDLSPYLKKVTDAKENNFASFNQNGEVIDSLLNKDSFASALHVQDSSKHITEEERESWNSKLDSTNADYLGLIGNAEKLNSLPSFTSIGEGLEIIDGILISKQNQLPIASESKLGGIKIDLKTFNITEDGMASIKIKEENGLKISENGLSLNLASAESAGAMNPDQVVHLANITPGAQPNIVEGLLLGAEGEEAFINERKRLILPIATTKLGIVKGSNVENQIKVEEDGTMTVNKISTSKLYVAEGDEFILYGGNA